MTSDASISAGPAAAAAPGRPLAGRLSRLVLSEDLFQRRCLSASLLALTVYAVCIAMLEFGASQKIFPAGPARLLGLAMAATSLGFYALIRSGLNRLFADPTLALAQALAAQTLAGLSYASSGPLHGGTLILLALVMVFGLFDLHVRHARVLAAYSVLWTGVVMVWRSHTDPGVYAPVQQLVYFVMVVTVMGSTLKLSVLLATMRARLKRQKDELQAALAHIQEMATRDELTGLANRRRMLDLLGEHALREARGGPSFHVALVDLDHFKSVNDTYGHAVGDDALRAFARQAVAHLRNTDIIGRWGGEEFLLLMPETRPGEPDAGLERLRAALQDCPASDHAPGLRVRFSAGLSRYRDGEAIADTIERADRGMYAAKAAGRNRTVAI